VSTPALEALARQTEVFVVLAGDFIPAAEVLTHRENLSNTFEVVVAAEGNQLAVLRNGRRVERAAVNEFIAEHSLEVAVFVVHGSAGIAVSRAAAFSTVSLGVRLEGVLGGQLETSKLRRLIGEGVIDNGGSGQTEHIPVTAVESVADSEDLVIGADGRAQSTDAAGGQGAVAAREAHLSFTAEETAVFISLSTIVRIELVSEIEGDGGVADLLFTLQAPAGGLIHAGSHAEFVGRGLAGHFLVLIAEAGINNAVERNGRSRKGGAGKRSKRSCRDEVLFHLEP